MLRILYGLRSCAVDVVFSVCRFCFPWFAPKLYVARVVAARSPMMVLSSSKFLVTNLLYLLHVSSGEWFLQVLCMSGVCVRCCCGIARDGPEGGVGHSRCLCRFALYSNRIITQDVCFSYVKINLIVFICCSFTAVDF